MQTFLFTDIEGSTRLWEEHTDDMATALARHDAILSEAVDRAGGKVVKTTGDGLLAVFDSVTETLAATIDAQRSLLAETWGPTGPLRVRMGVHAGETESRGGDYFGPAMNRAARVMAAGHGGQVLLSAAAAGLSDGRLPSGAQLRDLGMHRLKDLTLPEHLYQLVHEDIGAEFPAPVTLDARPNNLPVQTTEFLGRSNELAAIQVMLESPSTRLLTISGPGGAGKTSLGLQVAAEQMDRFRDGVFFVDLSAERDPDAAYETVVRTLDLPVSGGDPLQILKSRLRDQQMLLVLDNFEQVTAAAVGLSELLQHAPGLKIVVTSRETLRVRAEHVFPVPPLSLPHPKDPTASIAEAEAVQLFAERARAVRPGFAVVDENAAVIAEICLRLDGLPLAIELAAARLNVFTPSDLLDRLRERLDVLGAGGRDLPDRQRTLWGAIGWSYELLDENERDLFELMSVFSSTDLPALESVTSSALGAGLVLDPLASLVDKSLIRSEDDGTSQRFSMLLMIKEYAETSLADSPEREQAVRRAHALYFSEFGRSLQERLRGADRESAVDDLQSEIGNLRTAWRYWVDQGDLEQVFNLIDGLWALHEAKGWYHAAIELASDALEVLAKAEPSPELAAEELTLRTSLARALMAVHGYGVEVEEAFKRALEISQTVGTTAQRFPVLRALATYYMSIADFDQGMEYGRQLLALGKREGDETILIEGHYVLGAATAFAGDLDTGLPHLDTAIELHDPRVHGSARFRLGPNTGVVARTASGLILWQCGALERSVARLAESLQVARDIGHPYSIAYALYHNGFLALNRNRFEEAIERAHELAVVAEENDYLVWKTLSTVLEGVSLTALGQVEEGLAMTETGIDLYEGLTTPPVFWPLILSLRALVHALAGRPERALILIDEAIEFGEAEQVVSPEFRFLKGDFLRMLASTDSGLVEEEYLAGIRGAGEGGLRLLELQGLTRLVGLRRELGHSPDGSEELAAQYATFTEGLDEHPLVEARGLLG
ncbi:MAG TPA: adenylate/guanylate cyclase domain-containing protein [Acidimicrobiia bacterium]|nr:adenylate/guanylate cyclase domain-containing protein [Acidimicrobiia bacterium]